jgi:hypothetical protein
MVDSFESENSEEFQSRKSHSTGQEICPLENLAPWLVQEHKNNVKA